MSQQKGEMAGLAFVGAIIGLVAYFLVVAVATMLALSAIVFTVLALIAWNRPLYLGSETLEPAEARAFIYRGLFGAAAAPVLTFLVWLFLERHAFGWEIYALSAGVGYVIGSVGVEILAAMDEMETVSTKPVTSPSKPPALSQAQVKALPAPSPSASPAASKKPFRYASWNDEELRQ